MEGSPVAKEGQDTSRERGERLSLDVFFILAQFSWKKATLVPALFYNTLAPFEIPFPFPFPLEFSFND